MALQDCHRGGAFLGQLQWKAVTAVGFDAQHDRRIKGHVDRVGLNRR
jgi:hypothetical protein